MRGTLASFTLRAAVFLLIANLIMLLIVPFGSAEWYITVMSAGLMVVLIAIIRIVYLVKERRKK